VNPSKKISFAASFSALRSFMPFRLKIRLILLILLMVVSALSEMMSIGMIIPFISVITSPELVFANSYMKPIIEFFSIQTQTDLTLFLTMVFCIAAILSASIRLLTLWFQTRFCYSLGADLSSQLYKNSLYQPYTVHVARNSSEFISTIVNKTFQSTSFAILPLLNVLSSSLLLVGIVVTLLLVQPIVAITVFILFGALYGIVILLTRSKLDRDSERISFEQDEVVKKLQEGFGSIRDILIGNTQEVYLRSYSSSFKALQDAWANVEIIRSTPRFVIEAVGIVSIALLALYLSTLPEGLIGALPVLAAMALGAQRLLPILQLIYASISSLRAGFESLTDILQLLEQPSQESFMKGKHELIPFRNKIVLEHIKFNYDSKYTLILDNLNIQIAKGDMIGVIGTTGSGKSTLIDIIMGLLEPVEGCFSVDGKIINEFNRYGWQSQLAHVPQSIFLTDASIAENIALGTAVDKINFELVNEAAKQAQIHDAILSWEEGYNTIVGERGIRISGGQRQRIAIARALYKKASVIIFDEATSALDSKTESSVMEAIVELSNDLTIIIVAHRLSTLKNCTNIIELEDGKIIRQGVYNDFI
jgi:ATP-binding cassette subfamily B protein